MPEWRKIWMQAIRANRALCLDPANAGRAFARLRRDHPADGMVRYEAGEAYEFLGELALAAREYAEAERMLPVADWRRVARRASDRVERTRTGFSVLRAEDQWSVFHRIHQTPRIDPEARAYAIMAIGLWDEVPALAAMVFRQCLEIFMNELRAPGENLEQRVDAVDASESLKHDMHRVRRAGNRALHPEGRSRRDFEGLLAAFARVAEWVDTRTPQRPRRRR